MVLCSAYIKAASEFKYQNMYYVCTSDSTAKLSRGHLVGNVIIPDTVTKGGNKYAVTEIGSGAFLVTSNPLLTSVDIPATIKIIQTQAFSGQTGITDIYLRGENITFESGVFSISSFTSRKVHVKSFEAMCNNRYPESNNTGVRGANPFYKAYMYIEGVEVENVHLSQNLTSISNNAFEGLLNSISIQCDTGLISIGNYAFMDSKIENIDLPSSLQSIGEYAFRGCPIKNLTIPENVTSIGSYAFDYNNQFHKIIWKAKSLHCLSNMPGYSAFSLTSGQLDTLIIDTGVVNLPEYMFYSTIYTAKPIIISKNKQVPYIYENTFKAISKNSILYVPCGTKSAYVSAWGFKNVHEMVFDEEDLLALNKQAFADYIAQVQIYYNEIESVDAYETIAEALLEAIVAAQNVLENNETTIEDINTAISQLHDAFVQAIDEVRILGLGDIYFNDQLSRKKIIHGTIYIHCGEKVYTIDGREAK